MRRGRGTPGAASEYVAHGHTVLVETGAGAGIGVEDEAYVAAGAKIIWMRPPSSSGTAGPMPR